MTKYSKAVLLEIAEKYKMNLTSASEWNKFADKNHLPKAMSFSYHFGGWNKLKAIIFQDDVIMNDTFAASYSNDELIQIATENQEHFTTEQDWNLFAKAHALPLASVYIYAFHSWNLAKKIIFKDEMSLNKERHEKEQLIKIVLRNIEHFISIDHWNDYAGKNHLPKARTFIHTFGSWNNAKRVACKDKLDLNNIRYTDEQLIKFATEEQEQFTSISHWNGYAKENNLPFAQVYINRFGKWTDAKKVIFKIPENMIKKVEIYSDDALLQIALTNHEYFTSKKKWDLFGIPNKLPRAETFANRFGTWSKAKKIVQERIQN